MGTEYSTSVPGGYRNSASATESGEGTGRVLLNSVVFWGLLFPWESIALSQSLLFASNSYDTHVRSLSPFFGVENHSEDWWNPLFCNNRA